METEGNPQLTRMTAGRVGMVCRTKVEMYYFLGMEGKLRAFNVGVNTNRDGPKLLRPCVGNREGVDRPRAMPDDMHSEYLPPSGEDHRHVLPPTADEGRKEGRLPPWLAGVAERTGSHCRRASRKTKSRKPLCLTSRDSALRSSWPNSVRDSPCWITSRIRSLSSKSPAASSWMYSTRG